jgi:hypothetical protein
MTMRRLRVLSATRRAVVVCSLVLADDGLAQWSSAPPRAEFCASAIDALTSGTTETARVDGVWACPNIVEPLNAVLRASRTVRDSARLHILFRAGGRLTDDRLTGSALSIATDNGASELARAYAIRMLIEQMNPAAVLPPLSSGGSTGLSNACLTSYYSSSYGVEATPLSENTVLAIFNASTTLFRDPQNSLRVRYLANCLWHLTNPAVAPTVRTDAIELTYLCGTRFRVRNRNFAAVRLAWDVLNTPDRGEVSVPRSWLVTPPFDKTFFTTASGTVRLYRNGQLIRTAANGGTPCTTP